MDLFQVLILSAIEGITEFLPISSTGHLILTSQILSIAQTEFVKSFEIMIQPGAILAVLFLYWRKLLNVKIWPKVLIAFLPAAGIGFIFYKLIKEILIGNSMITVIALFVGGIAFIILEYWFKTIPNEKQITKIEDLTYVNSFLIGIFQSISVIPGVSRAGATILGGMLLKASRKTALEFSFILAIPTMFAASALEIAETKLSFTPGEISVLIFGFILSFIFALLAVKLFLRFISNHSLVPFGVYRILTAIIFYLLFIR